MSADKITAMFLFSILLKMYPRNRISSATAGNTAKTSTDCSRYCPAPSSDAAVLF